MSTVLVKREPEEPTNGAPAAKIVTVQNLDFAKDFIRSPIVVSEVLDKSYEKLVKAAAELQQCQASYGHAACAWFEMHKKPVDCKLHILVYVRYPPHPPLDILVDAWGDLPMKRVKDLIMLTVRYAPTPMVRLYFNGTILDERKTVGFYKFKEGDVIDAMISEVG